MRAVHLFILACSFSISALSQAPHIRKISLNLPEGEPVFHTAMQDRNGFIWLGSDQGLFRFDGKDVRHFMPAEDSIEFKVSSIHENPDGILWIGCKSGHIFRLTPSGLSQFQPEEGTPGAGISDIVTGPEGTTWWSTLGEGIYFYQEGRVYNISHEDGLKDDYVYDLLVDKEGMIWAGTDGGVAVCSQQAGRKNVEIPSWNGDLPDPIVRVLKSDLSGKIFLGFYESLPGYISPDGMHFVDLSPDPAWPYDAISDLALLDDAVWISTNSGKLLELGKDGMNEVNASEGSGQAIEKFGKIHKLMEDREGNLWILSATGLYRTTGSRWKFYDQADGIGFRNIHAIFYDAHDELWFSNDEGLFRLNPGNMEIRKYLDTRLFENLKITSLCEDPDGFVWAGTFNYGVFRIDPVTGAWKRVTEKEGLVNNNVLSISRHNDTLWMATLGGATEIVIGHGTGDQFKSLRSFDKSNGLVSNYIYSVFEDKNDRIWFATDGDGISVFDNGAFRTYNQSDGLGDDVIYSISGDKYGNIWIATSSAGVYRYDGKRFHRFGVEEGLSSLRVAGLETAGEEVLVMMDDGIDIIHIPTGSIIQFGDELAMGNISPDLNTITPDADGNLWIGTKTGILRYRPSSYHPAAGPVTVLEHMAVFLEPVEMKPELVLRNKDNHITFTYAGLWFSNPDKVSFQVMLEGYDLGWKNTFDNVAMYSSLPPGMYTFKARSSINQSFTTLNEVSFSFEIMKPLWANAWFILFLFVFVVLAVFLIMHYREKRLKKIEQQKKEKVEFEFQLLKNQVNPHFLFNSFSTLMALIEEQPAQALEYTEKLSDFFRTILQLKDEDVIPLADELRIIDDYFFLLKKRFGDNLFLEVRIDEKAVQSVIPPMTLQILLENAVKHNVISRDKPLFIKIYSEGKEIILENNLQPKKTAEVSTGIGLENITKRYRLKSAPDPVFRKSDTHFSVVLPILKLNNATQ
jgi:ligand-binding sensor domain-containing protein